VERDKEVIADYNVGHRLLRDFADDAEKRIFAFIRK
jgi:hypothetical protein